MKLKHSNGGGSVYGNEAFVAPSTFLDAESVVKDNGQVCCSVLVGSGVYLHGDVCGAFMRNSAVTNNARVRGPVQLTDVRVGGFASIVPIAGPVTLEAKEGPLPLIINKRMWIDRGHWTKPPAYAEVQGAGEMVVGLTRCIDDLAHVGCFCKPIEFWLSRGKKLAVAAGWSEESAKLARGVMEEWAKD